MTDSFNGNHNKRVIKIKQESQGMTWSLTRHKVCQNSILGVFIDFKGRRLILNSSSSFRGSP